MPGRKEIIKAGQVYHVLNRGIGSMPIFKSVRDYQRFSNTFYYYRNRVLPLRYSYFIRKSIEERNEILEKLNKKQNLIIEILSFCLMPNHFHFLLRPIKDSGIANFMSKLTNSYTRYFNTKRTRNGPLLQGKFKAIRIKADEQLLHVSRYIHLNPFTSYIVSNLEDLENYRYSSFPEFLGKTKISFCEKEDILGQFKSIKSYKRFVFDQADYQRQLQKFKNLMLEK